MTKRRVTWRQVLLALLAALVAQGQESAKIPARGRLLLPDGRPLAGATVIVQKRGEPPAANQSKRAGSSSNESGQFETPGVEEGEYDVCIGTDPNLGVLDPCEWPSEAKRLTVSPANAAARAIPLAVGPKMKFVIEDQERRLRHPREPVGFRPSALVGVFDASGFFHMARIVSADHGVYTYILPVPKGQTYTLHVSAPNVTFAERDGTPKQSFSSPVVVSAADPRTEIQTTLGVAK